MQEILSFRKSADCGDSPGGEVATSVRSRGRRPYSGPLRSRSGNPSLLAPRLRALPVFSGEFRVPVGGDGGVAAGGHEGELRLHWPWTLLLNTVTSLAVGLRCVVLIFMVGERLA